MTTAREFLVNMNDPRIGAAVQLVRADTTSRPKIGVYSDGSILISSDDDRNVRVLLAPASAGFEMIQYYEGSRDMLLLAQTQKALAERFGTPEGSGPYRVWDRFSASIPDTLTSSWHRLFMSLGEDPSCAVWRTLIAPALKALSDAASTPGFIDACIDKDDFYLPLLLASALQNALLGCAQAFPPAHLEPGYQNYVTEYLSTILRAFDALQPKAQSVPPAAATVPEGAPVTYEAEEDAF